MALRAGTVTPRCSSNRCSRRSLLLLESDSEQSRGQLLSTLAGAGITARLVLVRRAPGISRFLIEADGLILASPVYFADVTAEMKAIMDRAGYVARSKREMFSRKPGAAVVAVRRAGAMHAFDTMNHFFGISDMLTVGSSYWNIGLGSAKGDVAQDAEGMRTMTRLGENMAWLLGKLA